MAAFTGVAVLLVLFFSFSAAAAAGPLKTPAVVTSASYFSADSDVIDTAGWLRTLFGAQLDDDEEGEGGGRKCVKEDKVFHRPSRGCFLLFTRGPCAPYDWLVFDRESARSGNLTAACARRKCAPGWGFDSASGKCFRHGDCPAPLVFHYSLFGDGVCRCNGSSERLASGDPRACYPLYRHAPCPRGQMVAPRYQLFQGLDAVCFRDPCDGYKPPGESTSPAPVTTSAPTVTTGSHHVHHHHGGDAYGSGGAGFNGFTKYLPNVGGRPVSRDETISTGEFSQSAFNFEVEVMPVPNRPDLGIKTSTRAVVGSDNNPPPRNIAAPGSNNGSPTITAHHYHGLPPFKITLTPFRGRRRRGVPRPELEPRSARGARGEADPRVRDKAGGAAGAVWEIPDARSLERGVGAANVTGDYALQVQYADGTRSCMSPPQLNVTCDLKMAPLFSDFSELKVPICANTFFRFAIGRIGKSEECIQKDDGECATEVTVKSPDPLDWEYE